MSRLFPPLESSNAIETSSLPVSIASTRGSSMPMKIRDEEVEYSETGDNHVVDDVLSPELTHNFDALRSLLLDETKPLDDNSNNGTCAANSTNKRKTAEALAIETALLVEQEVAHLQNGILELEALLRASQRPQTPRSERRSRRRRRRRIDDVVPSLQQQQQYGGASAVADSDDSNSD